MQLHQLRYVVATIEQGSFTRAALRLRVAQPSVSIAIRALERELGVELFHRSAGAVVPTAAGTAFIPWARQVLADCDAGVAAVADLAGLARGRLSLGATPSITTDLLAPVLARFHRRHPGVELSLHEAGSQPLVASLERGELDLAVLVLPVGGSWVLTEKLLDEPLVLAVGPEHCLVERSDVSVADLDGLPLVMFREGYDLREAALGMCEQAGFRPPFSIEGPEMDGVLACVAAGLGAAVVPASVISPGGSLRALRFRDVHLRRALGVASRRDRPLSHAARAFGAMLRDALGTTGRAGG